MIVVSIDGACRRNGKPDCISAGAVFVQLLDDNGNLKATELRSDYETKSTNQRGELLALINALQYAIESGQDTLVVTDSEYLFNSMTKNWYVSWMKKGWTTANGDDVKNKDMWTEIYKLMLKVPEEQLIQFYHIKGHLVTIGTVTANRLLNADLSGRTLYNAVCKNYDTQVITKEKQVLDIQECSMKNNGFALPTNQLKRFACMNTVADRAATRVVDMADAMHQARGKAIDNDTAESAMAPATKSTMPVVEALNYLA